MNNPLADTNRQTSAGKPSKDRLYTHCDYLNGMPWVRESGLPYFVNKRDDGHGKLVEYVDRRTSISKGGIGG